MDSVKKQTAKRICVKRFQPLLLFSFFMCLVSLACSLSSSPVEGVQALPIQNLPTPLSVIETHAPNPTPTPFTCIVSAHVLQLRECAGLGCTVKDWLDLGEKLSIQQKENGWLLVTTSAGENGWVNSKFCGGS